MANPDLIGLLRHRGMEVDRAEAEQWLDTVGYYRLSGYWYPYRKISDRSSKREPHRLDTFQDGTRFADIVRL